MERNEIGKFYAVSFNEDIDLEFIVYDDKTFDCPILEQYGYNHIALNPRFRLFDYRTDKEGHTLAVRRYVYAAKPKVKGESPLDLIGRYDIDNSLFDFLDKNKMISYSNEMANLYGFKIKDQKGHAPYKRARKKGPILVKQRQGQLN